MTEKTMAPCGCGDCTLCSKVDEASSTWPRHHPIKEIPRCDPKVVAQELERARKLIAMVAARNPPIKLTVGDLSWCNSKKRRRSLADEMRKLDDWVKGLTVGDLSWVSARRYADKYE